MNDLISKTAKPRRGRPPKVAREHSDTRALLIRSGVEVLTESGFVSAGIDGILKKMGVPKGSFYHYFASKEEFGLAVIDNYDCYFAAKLDKFLLDEQAAPLQRLRNFADNAKTGIVRFNYTRGCLVGNLGQEVAILPDSYRQVLQRIFASWQTRVANCLQAAIDGRDISASNDCQRQAELFWIGWEGAVMRARLMQSLQPLDLFIDNFIAALLTDCK